MALSTSFIILSIIIGLSFVTAMFVLVSFGIALDSFEQQEKIFWFKICLISIAIAILLFVVGINGFKKVDNSPIIWTKIANERLVSLSDNNMTNGRIYARRGYVNEDLWYQYMVDIGGGGYVANKVPSNGTTVYFDNENPRCEWYEVSQEWWIFKQWETRWKLYVPEGTIGTTYNIDLQ